MNCKVQGVYKNLRYRILTIDGKQYILDTAGSFWKIVFPFFFWILPNSVYKVDDPNILEKLRAPEVKQENTRHSSLLGAGIGVFLATLLKPLMDYFDISSSPLVNTVILFVVLILIFVLCLFINNMFKKKLLDVVNPVKLSTDKLWIRPESIKHFFQVLFYYFFCLAFSVACYVAFIELGNAIMLFIGTLFLFVLPMISSVAPVKVGNTKVKFK